MLQTCAGDDNSRAPLAVALRAVVDLLRTKIVASDSDLVGVVAFGAGQPGRLSAASDVAWPGVRVVLPLDRPSADGIITLIRLAKRIENGDATLLQPGAPDSSKSRPDPNFSFGKVEPVQMDKALWAVRHQFSMKKATTASAKSMYIRCRTYIFTNDDDPTSGPFDSGANIKRLAVRNARDLSEAGVSIDVTLIKTREDQIFDPDRFFSRIVFIDEDDWMNTEGAINITSIANMDELASVVRRKEVKKRATSRTTISLGEDLKIGVALYSLVRKATRPSRVKVRREDMKRLHLVRDTFCDSTGETLGTESIRYTFDKLSYMKSNIACSATHSTSGDGANGETSFDGAINRSSNAEEDPNSSSTTKVEPNPWSFTSKELNELSRVGNPGLTLYGFRNVNALRPEHVLKPSYFVYPDETSYSGSTKVFAALLTSMQKKGKMALLCWNSRRHSSGPRFAYMVPQMEVVNDDGLQVVPPGMHLIPVPYMNDVYVAWRKELRTLKTEISHVDDENLNDYDDPQNPKGTAVASRLVSRILHKNFSCENYLNPDLQRFYAGLEWEAGVAEGVYDPGIDSLEPENDVLRQRAHARLHRSDSQEVDLLQAFKQITVGPEFDSDDIVRLYGTKSGFQAAEKLEKTLKRKREALERMSDAREKLDMKKFESAFEKGLLYQLKSEELKNYCRGHNLLVSGSKAVLTARVHEHMKGDEEEIT